MYGAPATFERLMDLLADTVIAYLLAQLAAGAQVLQLFDSWVGTLGPYDYERFAAPWSRKVIDAVGGHGAPVIHFANGASAMLPQVRAAGGDVDRGRLADRPGPRSPRARRGCRRPGQSRPGRAAGPDRRGRDARRGRARPRPRASGSYLQPRPRPAAADAARHRRAAGRVRPRLAGGVADRGPRRCRPAGLRRPRVGRRRRVVHRGHDGRVAVARGALRGRAPLRSDRWRLAAARHDEAAGRRPAGCPARAARRERARTARLSVLPADGRRVSGRARPARDGRACLCRRTRRGSPRAPTARRSRRPVTQSCLCSTAGTPTGAIWPR